MIETFLLLFSILVQLTHVKLCDIIIKDSLFDENQLKKIIIRE